MKLFEDVHISNSININVGSARVISFLKELKNDEKYREWHPEDHVSMKWVEGEPWEEGSICLAREYLGGELKTLKMSVNKVNDGKYIEYAPTSRFMRRYIPKLTFEVSDVENGCIFTATLDCRMPLIPRLLVPGKVKGGLDAARKHIREEGENMKTLLEQASA
ncbi:MAG: hypothetical protein GY835_01230 [bacterium]|nr:hypothetical protein [bacterium]